MDRQRDGYIVRWIDRGIYRQAETYIDGQIERYIDRQKNIQIDRKIYRQTEKYIDTMQIESQKERVIDSERDRLREIIYRQIER